MNSSGSQSTFHGTHPTSSLDRLTLRVLMWNSNSCFDLDVPIMECMLCKKNMGKVNDESRMPLVLQGRPLNVKSGLYYPGNLESDSTKIHPFSYKTAYSNRLTIKFQRGQSNRSLNLNNIQDLTEFLLGLWCDQEAVRSKGQALSGLRG